ncbi:MAG TPA: carboxypeptidase-like regulatory domain-containing protein [Bacteroidia bacterium]|nr:carboxypeptidase-like regulatory domain-containing protein [Bacteroidia bacterium]
MKKLSLLFALISLSIFFIFSCKKDKPDVAAIDYGNSNSLRTTVTGMVLDESNAPIIGVTVTAYGQTTATNQYGTFVLKDLNVNKDRCVLQFVKTGFFKRAHGFIASGNTVNYVRIILLSNAGTQNFSSSAGGTISLPDGSSAAFEPNSFVTTTGSTYTGTVNLIVKHLSPDDINFGFMIPGGDLLGKDLNNQDVALYTYGMLGVELTGSSGEVLQLANGTSATLTLSIAASQLSSAPATIPLWFFDETTSLWKEEGTANKVGNNYVGSVNHFSWWNCDIGTNSPLIKGKVVDCNGIPVPNIVVTVNGWATTLTNQNGEWQGQVPAGMALTAQVLSSNNGGAVLNSQLENIPALSSNQTFIVPDLVIPCPTRIIGILKTCSGEAIDGIVILTDNLAFALFQYTSNGSFNLISIPNAQLDLNAYNTINSFQQAVTSLNAPDILNVGDLYLCDTITSLGNNFVLDGGPFTNDYFNVVPDSTSPGQITNYIFLVHDQSTSNYEVAFHVGICGTVPGSYTWNDGMGASCNIIIQLTDSINQNTLHSIPSMGTTILTQFGPVGGRVTGSFEGVGFMQGQNINISGNFDFIREF